MRMNSNPIVQGESILGGEPLVRTGLPQVHKSPAIFIAQIGSSSLILGEWFFNV
jgi:hypothetical protein